MTRYLVLPLAFALFLANQIASAQADPAIPAMLAEPTCPRWNRGPTDAELGWILGYMSGLNTLHTLGDGAPRNPINRVDQDALIDRINKFCAANPRQRIGHEVLQVFLDAIRSSKLTGK